MGTPGIPSYVAGYTWHAPQGQAPADQDESAGQTPIVHPGSGVQAGSAISVLAAPGSAVSVLPDAAGLPVAGSVPSITVSLRR